MTHGKRNNIHGASSHAAVKEAVQRLFHLQRMHPIVCGTSISTAERANERSETKKKKKKKNDEIRFSSQTKQNKSQPVFDSSNVRRIAACQIRVGTKFVVEFDEGAGLNHLTAKSVVFLLGAVRNHHFLGLRTERKENE